MVPILLSMYSSFRQTGTSADGRVEWCEVTFLFCESGSELPNNTLDTRYQVIGR